MRTATAIGLSISLAGFAAHAQTAQPTAPEPPAAASGFRVTTGYQYLDLDIKASHNTNPGDSFLPNASVPGSAGTTRLGGANFFALGIGYEAPMSPSVSWAIDAGLLANGGEMDNQQNANDPRPAATAAFVYTKSDSIGFYLSGQVTTTVDPLYVGAKVELAGIDVSSGWNRFNTLQPQTSQMELYPSVGPVIGFRLGDGIRLEASVGYGRSLTGGVTTVFKF